MKMVYFYPPLPPPGVSGCGNGICEIGVWCPILCLGSFHPPPRHPVFYKNIPVIKYIPVKFSHKMRKERCKSLRLLPWVGWCQSRNISCPWPEWGWGALCAVVGPPYRLVVQPRTTNTHRPPTLQSHRHPVSWASCTAEKSHSISLQTKHKYSQLHCSKVRKLS